jgi:type IV fimbrial biogenesis protein FimT
VLGAFVVRAQDDNAPANSSGANITSCPWHLESAPPVAMPVASPRTDTEADTHTLGSRAEINDRRRSIVVGATGGFGIVELLVLIAITAIIVTVTAPSMLEAVRAFTVNSGAREMRAVLNQARALAITTRQNICLQAVAGGYTFRTVTCAGQVWIGPNTNAAGTFTPSGSVTLAGGNLIFTPFGTASQTTTITVSGLGGISTTVTVSPSGLVTIP